MTVVTRTSDASLVTEQAKALGLILEAALSASVALFDANSGKQLMLARNVAGYEFPPELSPGAVHAYAAQSRALVMTLGEQQYQAVLPIRAAGGMRLIALAVMARYATGELETKQETHRIETLCGLLLDRISSTPGRPKKPTETRSPESQICSVLAAYDVLFRNVRLHGDSSRFQRHSLKAVAEVINAELAIWVMGDKATVRMNRGTFDLSSWDCQQLVGILEDRSDWDPAEVLIDNSVTGGALAARFPQIQNLVAIRVRTDGLIGYVIVINKIGSGITGGPNSASQASAAPTKAQQSFSRGDAGLMASFSALIAAQARTARRHGDLKELIVGLTRALTSAIDAKDGYTAGHSERVARMAVELGKELGLAEEQLNDIYLSGLLHDIGKIGIRDEVLGKKGPLTDAEHDHIKEHVIIGHRILSGLTGIETLLGGVRHHHEQFNGRGYPDGLSGENIPRLARILAVADSFDAMSSDRPYRSGMPMEKIEKIFVEGRGEQWDPVIVDAFFRSKDRLREIRQRGIGDSLRDALDGVIRSEPKDEKASLVFATL